MPEKTKTETSVTITTPTDRELMFARTFDAPRTLVFDAYTNPKHLPHWMLGPPGWTMPVCEIDLRPGGAWHIVWRKADGTEMAMHGAYKEVTPPERMVATENWGGEWPETINTTTFAEQNGKTTITVRILYPSKEARDAVLKTGMKEGVNLSYNRLAAYLEKM